MKPDLQADFDAAFIRVRPGDFDWRFGKDALTPRVVSKGDLRKAQNVFDEYIGRTLNLDLTDLSRDRWSLTPASGDLIAEVRTRKFGSLTYARAGKDAEDVSLFDRRRRRNISIYASSEKLAARGRFYNEDDGTEYDVLHLRDRGGVRSRAALARRPRGDAIRIRALALTTLTLRLAEPLTVRSILSPELGRLLHLRVVGQNSVIVNLAGNAHPECRSHAARELQRPNRAAGGRTGSHRRRPAEPGIPGGRANPARAAMGLQQPQLLAPADARSPITRPRKLRIIVPAEFDALPSGTPVGPSAPVPDRSEPGNGPRKMFLFESDRPARYLACVISRFSPVTTARLNVSSGRRGRRQTVEDGVSLIVQANPRQVGKARSLADGLPPSSSTTRRCSGMRPIPSFTLAVAEAELPGGHSPPYFAILNQTLPMSTNVWRNDPVSFDNYSEFFLAHELAHQWWGQAVGWKNYHEQWISEGFAQYFAALYARGRTR